MRQPGCLHSTNHVHECYSRRLKMGFIYFTANWKPQEQKEITPKVEKSPPQAKVKKVNPKPKGQKKQASAPEKKIQENPPSQPPIDIANDDNDDDFWDFYDKPFNKPK